MFFEKCASPQNLAPLADLVAFVVLPIATLFLLKYGWQVAFGSSQNVSRRQLETQQSWSDGLERIAAALPKRKDDAEAPVSSNSDSESDEVFAAPQVTPLPRRVSARKNLVPLLKAKTPTRSPRTPVAKKSPKKKENKTPRRSASAKKGKMSKELIDLLDNRDQFFGNAPPTPQSEGGRRSSMRLRNRS